MNRQILDFLKKERVCSFSVILPDGSPHSAAVHYSHQDDPLKFFIQTYTSSTKYSPFITGGIVKAAIVVGFSEQEWLTLQVRGSAKMIADGKDLERAHTIHYAKHPDAKQWENDPETVFLEFTPTWWRFTDFKTNPETVVEM